MVLLNLGCGTKVSSHRDVVNIDWSIYLRLRRSPVLRRLTPFFVSGQRLERFNQLPDNVLVHNLARGVPFPDASVDAVYHSHVLEHLDRPIASKFMQEVWRVLKPGGIQRIVVPDLEAMCGAYLAHLPVAELDAREADRHDDYVAAMLEQCVRVEARGTSQQPPLRRFIENRLLGDARAQGDTHQWMYDRVNIRALLTQAEYSDIRTMQFDLSGIPNWSAYGLDRGLDGAEYKPNSLYVECRK